MKMLTPCEFFLCVTDGCISIRDHRCSEEVRCCMLIKLATYTHSDLNKSQSSIKETHTHIFGIRLL